MLNTLDKHCYINFKVKDVLKIKFSPQNWTKWYPYLLAAFLGYVVADLVILSIRPSMLPTKVPPAKPSQRIAQSNENRGTYNTIIARNIFNWDGVIPDAIPPVTTGSGRQGPGPEDPVLSQLPLNLIGTIVHSNPDKSVATIELKGKNMIVSYRNKTDIENMATITKIERGKVTFRNMNNNQLEFIEAQTKNKLSFKGSKAPLKAGNANSDVTQVGNNQFQLKRADLLKYTNNLAGILQQARSVPNRNPQTGEIDGFRLLDFQPGSIFEKLGLQRMDVIKGVNGDPVDSPAKAMELYNALKNSDKINISVERNGKTESLDYTIQ
jgi:general secretion pathway protein C